MAPDYPLRQHYFAHFMCVVSPTYEGTKPPWLFGCLSLILFLLVCLCACVLVCLGACVLVCLCACVLVCLCACVLVCLCACVLVCLCACAPFTRFEANFLHCEGGGFGPRGPNLAVDFQSIDLGIIVKSHLIAEVECRGIGQRENGGIPRHCIATR